MLLPGATSKKLIIWVRPGVRLTKASLRRPHIALIALDFPALERPTNATSDPMSRGSCSICAALAAYRIAWNVCGCAGFGAAIVFGMGFMLECAIYLHRNPKVRGTGRDPGVRASRVRTEEST